MPSTVMFVGGLFLPETPNSFVEQGRLDEAREILVKVGGTEKVDAEFEDLKEVNEEARSVNNPFRNLLKPKNWPQLIIGALAILAFLQLLGMNSILFYSPVIFQSLGFGSGRGGAFSSLRSFIKPQKKAEGRREKAKGENVKDEEDQNKVCTPKPTPPRLSSCRPRAATDIVGRDVDIFELFRGFVPRCSWWNLMTEEGRWEGGRWRRKGDGEDLVGAAHSCTTIRIYPPPKWDLEGGAYDRTIGDRRNWILVWEDGFCNFAACDPHNMRGL